MGELKPSDKNGQTIGFLVTPTRASNIKWDEAAARKISSNLELAALPIRGIT